MALAAYCLHFSSSSVLKPVISARFSRPLIKHVIVTSDNQVKMRLYLEMLELPGQGPLCFIMDAIDEGQNSSWFPTPRKQVL